MRPRRRLLVAVPLAAAAALGGVAACAPYHAGAAATVGDTRIGTDQLRAVTDRVLAAHGPFDPTASTTEAAFQVTAQQDALGGLVTQQLLDAMAARYAVSVTPAQVGTVRSELAQNLTEGADAATDPAAVAAQQGYDLDQQARIVATYQALIDGGAVTDADAIAALGAEPDPADYQVVPIQLRTGLTSAQIQQAVAEVEADPKGILQQLEQGGASVQPVAVPGVELAAAVGHPGTYAVGQVAGPVSTQQGPELLLISAVRKRDGVDALQRDSAERQYAFSQDYLAEQKALGVHVNPRFGSWDPTGESPAQVPTGSVGAGAPALSIEATSAPVASLPATGTTGTGTGTGS